MKKQANDIMRWALLVFLAFAMPSMASAQFGGLKKAVKSSVKETSKSGEDRQNVPDFYKKKQQQQTA